MTAPPIRPNPRLANPRTGIHKRKPKKQELKPYAYDLAYGADSAAQPGTVMMRISLEGKILVEINMPPEEFLTLAHSFEVVARAVSEALTKP